MNIKYFRFFTVFTVVVSVFIGGGCTPEQIPSCDSASSVKPERQSTEPFPTTSQLVVYLDASASMAGYVSPNGRSAFAVSPDGSTLFSKTLLELRNVVTMLGDQPQVVIRRVDSDVSAPSFSDLDLSRAAVDRSIYNGSETDLAGAVAKFGEPLELNTDEERVPKFHILVTDGVQSSKLNNTASSCAKGSDSFCVKKQILGLINKGWGGTVIGLRSEFDGNIYREISGGSFLYSSGRNGDKFRPFYLYIFSPDRAALDQFTDLLRGRLSRLEGGIGLRQFSLTSEYTTEISSIEVTHEKSTKRLLRIAPVKRKTGAIPCLTVESHLDTEKDGLQQFSVTVAPAWSQSALATGDQKELASMIRWELKPIDSQNEDARHRYPLLKKVTSSDYTLTFETGWDKGAGDTGWRVYHLIGWLNTEMPAPPWVSAWTTNLDSTADQANKTLNIESSLGGLWKNPVNERHPVAEVIFRVGKL